MTARKTSAGEIPAEDAALEHIKSLDADGVRALFAAALGEALDKDFEVVGDAMVCHKYDGLALSLVVPMSILNRWTETNGMPWREQLSVWQSEIIPAEVLSAIQEAAAGDSIAEVELCRAWSRCLDVRLGKALI